MWPGGKNLSSRSARSTSKWTDFFLFLGLKPGCVSKAFFWAFNFSEICPNFAYWSSISGNVMVVPMHGSTSSLASGSVSATESYIPCRNEITADFEGTLSSCSNPFRKNLKSSGGTNDPLSAADLMRWYLEVPASMNFIFHEEWFLVLPAWTSYSMKMIFGACAQPIPYKAFQARKHTWCSNSCQRTSSTASVFWIWENTWVVERATTQHKKHRTQHKSLYTPEQRMVEADSKLKEECKIELQSGPGLALAGWQKSVWMTKAFQIDQGPWTFQSTSSNTAHISCSKVRSSDLCCKVCPCSWAAWLLYSFSAVGVLLKPHSHRNLQQLHWVILRCQSLVHLRPRSRNPQMARKPRAQKPFHCNYDRWAQYCKKKSSPCSMFK